MSDATAPLGPVVGPARAGDRSRRDGDERPRTDPDPAGRRTAAGGQPAEVRRRLPKALVLGARRWLGQRPGVLAATVRRVQPADVLIAAVVAVTWFGGIRLLADSSYWYPIYLGRYWIAGWWIAGTLLLRRAAPVGTFWLTMLVYPVMYEAPIVNDLHLVPLLVVAVSVMIVRGLHPALVAVVAALSVTVLSLGYSLVAGILRWGGLGRLFDSHYMSFEFDPWDTVTRVALVVAASVIGTVLGRLEETRRTLERRNAQLLALQEVRAREAVRTERTRIARELHDVVAHHVSAIVVRAQAADRVADDAPDEPRDAVRWIAGTGREALDAMRTVVRVLRAEDADTVALDQVAGPTSAPIGAATGGLTAVPTDVAPPSTGLSWPDLAGPVAPPGTGPVGPGRSRTPGRAWPDRLDGAFAEPPVHPLHPTDTLAALPAVLGRVTAAGLAVDAQLPDPLPMLPPATELAVLRVAQEALTNVLLHSAAVRAELRLEVEPGRLLLVVRDDGPARPQDDPGGGNGLLHMRERALAVGGALRAGPSGAGWSVELELVGGAS